VIFFFFFYSSLNLSDRYHTYFYTWCGPSANLECRSEMCFTRLAGNSGTQKNGKNSPSGHHRTTLSGYIFATEARVDNDNRN